MDTRLSLFGNYNITFSRQLKIASSVKDVIKFQILFYSLPPKILGNISSLVLGAGRVNIITTKIWTNSVHAWKVQNHYNPKQDYRPSYNFIQTLDLFYILHRPQCYTDLFTNKLTAWPFWWHNDIKLKKVKKIKPTPLLLFSSISSSVGSTTIQWHAGFQSGQDLGHRHAARNNNFCNWASHES